VFSIGPVQIEFDELVDLRFGVHLMAVERSLQIVQLVGVGFFAEDRRLVVVLEGFLDLVGIVHEIENEHVVFLAVRPV